MMMMDVVVVVVVAVVVVVVDDVVVVVVMSATPATKCLSSSHLQDMIETTLDWLDHVLLLLL